MAISVKNYTSRYIAIVILIVMAVWALLFYAFMMEEVYDNVDDGLKNQKIEIIRAVYRDSTLLETKEFGVNQFRITPATGDKEVDKNTFMKAFIFMPYDNDDEPYRILKTGFYSKDGVPYELEIRTSTVEEDEYLIDLATALAVLYVVIVLSILIVNYFVLSKAWKPFDSILKNVKGYRFGDFKSFRSINTNVSEFIDLNISFEAMINHNEKVFDDQKRFLENASHELQTPLAITIHKLELLMDDDSLNESQLLKISEAKHSLRRMVNLNKSLLMLSRIDNDQYNNTEEVRCNDVLGELIAELNEVIEYQEITLVLKESADFLIRVNPNLISILFSNLIRNAIKYNIKGGNIEIDITANEVTISNTSASEALNPAYIFERFYKGKQDNQSNGLGLSIVESILAKYPFLTIAYFYRNNRHFFSLKK